MKQFFQVLIVALLFSSCGKKNQTADDGIYFQDFDNLKMFTRNAQVKSEQAHSGNFAAFTDENNEYGLTFEMDYSYAKSKGYKKMKAEGWVYKDQNDGDGSLVTSIESPSGSPSYQKADIKSFVNQERVWKQINSTIDIPESAPEGSVIKIYLWSPSKSKLFLDDLTVRFAK